jgi:uncharacterized repeat protein (TIGR01451 family)
MNLRANPFRALPIVLAFLLNVVIGPLAPMAQQTLTRAAADGIDDYAQCQIGNPKPVGLDCAEKWTNGILNATHNDYAEDEVVPQRMLMDFGGPGAHSVTLSYMARKDSSGQRHAYDYLATWNYTYVNANRCQTPTATACIGGAASTFPIPSDSNSVSPGGPQPTSAHELPQADRQFVMYGGTLTGTSAITHSVDPAEAGSDYGNITVNFTVGAGGKVQLLFGGHLASGFGPRGWGENLGSGAISGGPYHIRVTAIDGESIGNRDNQIMSNAIAQLLPTLTVAKTPDGGSVTAGDYASFTITVTNNGPGAATNVDIDDTLPAGPSGNLSWAEFPDKAECAVVSNVLHCDIASLADDASFSITVRALTDADDCGILNNTASADADNNAAVSDDGDITVLCGDIDVDKTPDGGEVTAGDTAAFTIVTSNSGDGAAKGAELSDVLPAVANGWSIDSEDWAGDCTISGAAGAAQTLECGPEDIPALPADNTRSVTVETVTTADDCGLLDNPKAEATTTNDGSADDSGDITVLCPDLDATKVADDEVVSAGQPIGFTITVSNSADAGTGTATNVELNDPLPAGSELDWEMDPDNAACDITGSPGAETLECSFGDLGAGDSVSVHLVSGTTKLDCATFPNMASVTADNHEQLNPSDDTTVECPGLNISKRADNGQIVAGDTASYTVVVWNALGSGTALNASWSDELPHGVSWSVELLNPDGDDSCASSINSDGDQAASCQFGDLAPSSMADGKTIVISGETDRSDCAGLDNTAFAFADNADTVQASALIGVRCPELVIDKSADTEVVHFVFDSDGNVLSVDPEQVTWTLSYTLTDGPVTDAVITDPLPEFLDFVSASNGGVYDPATRTITWELGDLLVDGSANVSFVTTVDPDAPETEPILNVATIVSNETPEDEGEDSIVVTSESELGDNPSPKPSVPNTAVVFGPAGEPFSIPVELLVVLFMGSLGGLALANVRAARRRR